MQSFIGNAIYSNPAAYGSVPAAPGVGSTAGTTTPQAMNAGQSVYNQLPGYNASLANVGANIQSQTAGELPADVQRQLEQAAAERGVATGSPGSPNSSAAYLRSLGLTSLDMTQRGQQNLQSILPTLPGANIANNPGFYVTPGQQYEAGLQGSIFASAPNPAAAAAAKMQAAQAGLSAGGGMMGGGGIPAPTRIGSSADQQFMQQPWEQPNPGAVGASGPGTGGTVIGGNYYAPGQTLPGGGSNNLPMLDQMISNYDPSAPYQGNDPALQGLNMQDAVDAQSPAYEPWDAGYDLSVEQGNYYDNYGGGY